VKTLFDEPFEDEGTGSTESADIPAAPAPRVRTVFTVSELTSRIRELLETELFEVSVEGELSNCKVWTTGHLYFTLKDPVSQVRALMYRSALRYLRFKPEDGLRVIARGRITVYDPKGEYQLVCEHLEPYGLGARQLAFEQLKRRLEAEGLFDRARKRVLPSLPRKIGIVTSTDGAALRDILNVLGRRYPSAHVVIQPSRVQGDGAAAEVARGLRAIARIPGVDVVIVARGGGSIEDLWAFNEETLARAIAKCPIPVISAVGHEIDVTISDLVADLRAPTPSAAAELVIAKRDDFRASIDRLAERGHSLVTQQVARRRTRLVALERRPGLGGWPARLALQGRHVAELSHELRQALGGLTARRIRRFQAARLQLETWDLRRRLGRIRTRLTGADGRLAAATTRRYHRRQRELAQLSGQLDALSPLAVLGRGYSVCWTGDRSRIVRDASRVESGERVTVTLDRGELGCRVETVRMDDGRPRGTMPDAGSVERP
jgi:exodeoxyribonuclease VII large subunit